MAATLVEAAGDEALVVALVGPLGAGKTAFVRGLARGLGADPAQVASPTFTIAHEYPAGHGRRLAHLDLYRVESADELDATGWVEWLAADTWLAIEWSDRFPEALPIDRLQVTLARSPASGSAALDAGAQPTARRVLARAGGARAERALAAWARAWASRDDRSGSPAARDLDGAREWP